MNKKNVAAVMFLLLFAVGIMWIVCFEGEDGDMISKIINKEGNNESKNLSYDEIRGVWISYIELSEMIQGKSIKEFEDNIDSVIDNMKSIKLNTAVVQVRAFSDAVYKSSYYPWASYCKDKNGGVLGYDPLKVMCDKFHKKGIRIEAWINPYRVKTDKTKLNEVGGEIKKWIEEDSPCIVSNEQGVFLNPAREEVRTLIVNGVKEIVSGYDVDGIHFDDYFYPQGDSFDEAEYKSYTESGEELSKEDWRRENVNMLVKEVYSSIKNIKNGVVFGISPQGNLNNDYNTQFIDVEKWIENEGFVDYICPQIYYGFNNSSNSFSDVLSKFESMDYKSAKMYAGLAAYKIGKEDAYAGNGRTEWIDSVGILKKQIDEALKSSKCSGFILFRYNSLFKPEKELNERIRKELLYIK